MSQTKSYLFAFLLGLLTVIICLAIGDGLIGVAGTIKYIVALSVWAFCMAMVKLYAPADTENVPILRKQERRQKQIFSYIILTLEIIIAIFTNNTIIAGIIIFGNLIQTLTITRFAYKITKNQYGHEAYANT